MFRLRVATFICLLTAASSVFAQAIDVQAVLNGHKGGSPTSQPKPRDPAPTSETKPPSSAGSAPTPPPVVTFVSGCQMETLMLPRLCQQPEFGLALVERRGQSAQLIVSLREKGSRRRCQRSTVLSHLQGPTHTRRVPCSGCHGEGKRAFENPIPHRTALM